MCKNINSTKAQCSSYIIYFSYILSSATCKHTDEKHINMAFRSMRALIQCFRMSINNVIKFGLYLVRFLDLLAHDTIVLNL